MSAALDGLLARFQGVRRNGSGWQALCPAHEDRKPSLSIREKNGKVLLKCFAECTTEAVCAAAGIEMRELFADNGSAPRIVAEYDYTDERGTLLYQNVRLDPKDFRLRRPGRGKGEWTWKMSGVRRVLYKLPEVLAAKEVLIVEGEKDADTGKGLGLTATTSGGANTWRDEFSEVLRGKRITIIEDADEAGHKYALGAACSSFGKAKSLKLLKLPGAKDLTEWVERGGTREALLNLIQDAPEWKPQSVEGGTVLDALQAYIRRFVSLSESQARAAALWVIHTHVFSAADATPYLAITSAEKQSGKTRLLEVLETLVANPWFTGRVTAAVLTRKVDAEGPTLLLDESDAAFGGEKEYAEALRGILNTGHRAGGKASCCVRHGANVSFRDFSTFCPKAIAGIGKLPDTVGDRAIPIRLKRAAPGEGVERFRRRDVEAVAAHLREQVETWSVWNAKKLLDARPELPDALTDRQQDGAEPLLAIADLAGGRWPQAARVALVELCAEAQASDDSIGKLLLADIRQILESRGVDRIASAELATALAEIETSQWGEWTHGKPLTASRLARLLRRFVIVPHSIRIGDKTPKGYEREDFQDAFRRYLRVVDTTPTSSPGSQSATAQQTALDAASVHFQAATLDTDVADQNSPKPASNGPCCGVAVQVPQGTGKRVVEVEI